MRNPTALTLTRDQARRVDAWAVETLGLPSAVLMENAALNLAWLGRVVAADIGLPDDAVAAFLSGRDGAQQM